MVDVGGSRAFTMGFLFFLMKNVKQATNSMDVTPSALSWKILTEQDVERIDYGFGV